MREILYPELKEARDKLRDAKRCINGPRDPSTNIGKGGIEHGPVVQAGKCQRCLDVYNRIPVPGSRQRPRELARPGGALQAAVHEAAAAASGAVAVSSSFVLSSRKGAA